MFDNEIRDGITSSTFPKVAFFTIFSVKTLILSMTFIANIMPNYNLKYIFSKSKLYVFQILLVKTLTKVKVELKYLRTAKERYS